MKKLTIIIVLELLCLLGRVLAQDTNHIKPLKQGDKLPSLNFTQLVNSDTKSIKTDDYKDQLLIIDFWSTWCTSCIKMFPAIEGLQKKFEGKVKFLAIDSWKGDTQEKLKALFARHPEWNFPTVYGDTIASRLFPHQGVPFYVWVKDNKLLATTGTEAIDADTIQTALGGDFHSMVIENVAYDMNRPIFHAGNGGEPTAYSYRSLLTPYAPHLKSISLRSTNDKGLTDRLLFVNYSIYQLLGAAFPVLGQVNKNRLTTGDGVKPDLFVYGASFQWRSRNVYTYEALFPPRQPPEALILMQEDMRRYFGLTIDSAIVERECLVFRSSSAVQSKIIPIKGNPETNWYTPELNIPITLTHYPLSEALQLFDGVSELPVLNKTTSDPEIDLRLKTIAVNEQELRPALKKYGVEVSHEKRNIRIYIIRQTGEAMNPTNLNKP